MVDILLEDICSEHLGYLTAHCEGYLLGSAFQPIYSLAHQRTVGYEALLRPRGPGNEPVSPLKVFEQARSTEEQILLDRVSRLIHVNNFRRLELQDSWLFLNISPRVVVEGRDYGSFFAELLARTGVAPERVVVEVLESAIDDPVRLAESIAFYRDLGCLIAIDDFGTGHSNFDRIVKLAPDIVKLDGSLLHQATESPVARRILPNLVSLLREAGCLVLLEGVETQEHALIALDADCDFAQGYHFARPAAPEQVHSASHFDFSPLSTTFRERSEHHSSHYERRLAPYRHAFDYTTAAFAAGAESDVACFRLLNSPEVLRCYVLDRNGVQVGENVVPQGRDKTLNPKLHPLGHTDGASWYRRQYFRDAINAPGITQITRPYLSITGARMCVTLSRAVERDGNTYILCCDVEWED